MDGGKKAARAWLRAQGRQGRAASLPVVVLALFGTALAIGQAFCAAGALGAALAGGGAPLLLLGGFALLAQAAAGGGAAMR